MTATNVETKSVEADPLKISVEKIRAQYNKLGRTGKFFYPSAIKRELESKESSAEKISDAIIRGIWYPQRIMYPELAQFKLNREPFEAIEKRIESLKQAYNKLNSFQQFFFPSAFKKLMKENKASELELAKALYQGTRFYHKLFSPSLLGAYFSSENTESARWLFDPKGIPQSTQLKEIENNLGELEVAFNNDDAVNTSISTLKEYFKAHALVKYFLPANLCDLLSEKNTNQLHPKIDITHAIFNLPWYSRLLLRIFYPSMLKQFMTPAITKFHKQIEERTILSGDARVERNLKTLSEIAKQAQASNSGKLSVSPTLHLDIANLICRLNRSGKQTRNMNAQLALDLIRLSSSSTHSEAILYICDAVTLYFKGDSGNNGNHELTEIVTKLKEKVDFLDLYVYLRQEKMNILSSTDPSTTKQNLDDIFKIRQPAEAQATFDILHQHQLITKGYTYSQTNFKRMIEFQNTNDLIVFNNQLTALSSALKNLSANFKIEQPLFDAFMMTNANNTVQLIEKLTEILNLMNLDNKAFKQEAYPLFCACIKKKNSSSTGNISEYLTKLQVTINRLADKNLLNLDNLKKLLQDDVDPIAVQKTIFNNAGLVVEEPVAVIASLPPQEPNRVRAQTSGGLVRGLAENFAQWWNSQPTESQSANDQPTDSQSIERRPQQPSTQETIASNVAFGVKAAGAFSAVQYAAAMPWSAGILGVSHALANFSAEQAKSVVDYFNPRAPAQNDAEPVEPQFLGVNNSTLATAVQYSANAAGGIGTLYGLYSGLSFRGALLLGSYALTQVSTNQVRQTLGSIANTATQPHDSVTSFAAANVSNLQSYIGAEAHSAVNTQLKVGRERVGHVIEYGTNSFNAALEYRETAMNHAFFAAPYIAGAAGLGALMIAPTTTLRVGGAYLTNVYGTDVANYSLARGREVVEHGATNMMTWVYNRGQNMYDWQIAAQNAAVNYAPTAARYAAVGAGFAGVTGAAAYLTYVYPTNSMLVFGTAYYTLSTINSARAAAELRRPQINQAIGTTNQIIGYIPTISYYTGKAAAEAAVLYGVSVAPVYMTLALTGTGLTYQYGKPLAHMAAGPAQAMLTTAQQGIINRGTYALPVVIGTTTATVNAAVQNPGRTMQAASAMFVIYQLFTQNPTNLLFILGAGVLSSILLDQTVRRGNNFNFFGPAAPGAPEAAPVQPNPN